MASPRSAARRFSSTHLLAEVEEHCTRVLILNRGRVATVGTVSEVARTAAAARSARVRVAPERVEDALAALARAARVESVERADGLPGGLVVRFASAGEESGTVALLALAEASIPVLAFELEGARLSDAFLAMTGAD